MHLQVRISYVLNTNYSRIKTDGLGRILIQVLIAAKHLVRVFTNYTNTTVYVIDNSKLRSYNKINYNT